VKLCSETITCQPGYMCRRAQEGRNQEGEALTQQTERSRSTFRSCWSWLSPWSFYPAPLFNGTGISDQIKGFCLRGLLCSSGVFWLARTSREVIPAAPKPSASLKLWQHLFPAASELQTGVSAAQGKQCKYNSGMQMGQKYLREG